MSVAILAHIAQRVSFFTLRTEAFNMDRYISLLSVMNERESVEYFYALQDQAQSRKDYEAAAKEVRDIRKRKDNNLQRAIETRAMFLQLNRGHAKASQKYENRFNKRVKKTGTSRGRSRRLKKSSLWARRERSRRTWRSRSTRWSCPPVRR